MLFPCLLLSGDVSDNLPRQCEIIEPLLSIYCAEVVRNRIAVPGNHHPNLRVAKLFTDDS